MFTCLIIRNFYCIKKIFKNIVTLIGLVLFLCSSRVLGLSYNNGALSGERPFIPVQAGGTEQTGSEVMQPPPVELSQEQVEMVEKNVRDQDSLQPFLSFCEEIHDSIDNIIDNDNGIIGRGPHIKEYLPLIIRVAYHLGEEDSPMGSVPISENEIEEDKSLLYTQGTWEYQGSVQYEETLRVSFYYENTTGKIAMVLRGYDENNATYLPVFVYELEEEGGGYQFYGYSALSEEEIVSNILLSLEIPQEELANLTPDDLRELAAPFKILERYTITHQNGKVNILLEIPNIDSQSGEVVYSEFLELELSSILVSAVDPVYPFPVVNIYWYDYEGNKWKKLLAFGAREDVERNLHDIYIFSNEKRLYSEEDPTIAKFSFSTSDSSSDILYEIRDVEEYNDWLDFIARVRGGMPFDTLEWKLARWAQDIFTPLVSLFNISHNFNPLLRYSVPLIVMLKEGISEEDVWDNYKMSIKLHSEENTITYSLTVQDKSTGEEMVFILDRNSNDFGTSFTLTESEKEGDRLIPKEDGLILILQIDKEGNLLYKYKIQKQVEGEGYTVERYDLPFAVSYRIPYLNQILGYISIMETIVTDPIPDRFTVDSLIKILKDPETYERCVHDLVSAKLTEHTLSLQKGEPEPLEISLSLLEEIWRTHGISPNMLNPEVNEINELRGIFKFYLQTVAYELQNLGLEEVMSEDNLREGSYYYDEENCRIVFNFPLEIGTQMQIIKDVETNGWKIEREGWEEHIFLQNGELTINQVIKYLFDQQGVSLSDGQVLFDVFTEKESDRVVSGMIFFKDVEIGGANLRGYQMLKGSGVFTLSDLLGASNLTEIVDLTEEEELDDLQRWFYSWGKRWEDFHPIKVIYPGRYKPLTGESGDTRAAYLAELLYMYGITPLSVIFGWPLFSSQDIEYGRYAVNFEGRGNREIEIAKDEWILYPRLFSEMVEEVRFLPSWPWNEVLPKIEVRRRKTEDGKYDIFVRVVPFAPGPEFKLPSGMLPSIDFYFQGLEKEDLVEIPILGGLAQIPILDNVGRTPRKIFLPREVFDYLQKLYDDPPLAMGLELLDHSILLPSYGEYVEFDSGPMVVDAPEETFTPDILLKIFPKLRKYLGMIPELSEYKNPFQGTIIDTADVLKKQESVYQKILDHIRSDDRAIADWYFSFLFDPQIEPQVPVYQSLTVLGDGDTSNTVSVYEVISALMKGLYEGRGEKLEVREDGFLSLEFPIERIFFHPDFQNGFYYRYDENHVYIRIPGKVGDEFEIIIEDNPDKEGDAKILMFTFYSDNYKKPASTNIGLPFYDGFGPSRVGYPFKIVFLPQENFAYFESLQYGDFIGGKIRFGFDSSWEFSTDYGRYIEEKLSEIEEGFERGSGSVEILIPLPEELKQLLLTMEIDSEWDFKPVVMDSIEDDEILRPSGTPMDIREISISSGRDTGFIEDTEYFMRAVAYLFANPNRYKSLGERIWSGIYDFLKIGGGFLNYVNSVISDFSQSVVVYRRQRWFLGQYQPELVIIGGVEPGYASGKIYYFLPHFEKISFETIDNFKTWLQDMGVNINDDYIIPLVDSAWSAYSNNNYQGFKSILQEIQDNSGVELLVDDAENLQRGQLLINSSNIEVDLGDLFAAGVVVGSIIFDILNSPFSPLPDTSIAAIASIKSLFTETSIGRLFFNMGIRMGNAFRVAGMFKVGGDIVSGRIGILYEDPIRYLSTFGETYIPNILYSLLFQFFYPGLTGPQTGGSLVGGKFAKALFTYTGKLNWFNPKAIIPFAVAEGLIEEKGAPLAMKLWMKAWGNMWPIFGLKLEREEMIMGEEPLYGALVEFWGDLFFGILNVFSKGFVEFNQTEKGWVMKVRRTGNQYLIREGQLIPLSQW